eukprot:CAMPEP_0202120246 /NCGR_PEP_ID=MMETSP0965-20130614/44053_1 /ASSEMBLY_ACC=CAM_ASM_000507 /TAXON_ID=4773 /ORGANISM="Schizochytrium aggregatum, Strain ATCC28209" /LENGTH=85 /DNA_ID=CAMNT_0048690169 /DNA_START=829 /DNA_END=1083 /DNA_ORIENTATION=-
MAAQNKKVFRVTNLVFAVRHGVLLLHQDVAQDDVASRPPRPVAAASDRSFRPEAVPDPGTRRRARQADQTVTIVNLAQARWLVLS